MKGLEISREVTACPEVHVDNTAQSKASGQDRAQHIRGIVRRLGGGYTEDRVEKGRQLPVNSLLLDWGGQEMAQLVKVLVMDHDPSSLARTHPYGGWGEPTLAN